MSRAQGSDLVWVDPVPQARHGRKRHAYEESGSSMVRFCGTAIGGNALAEPDSLNRKDATAFAVLPNACLGCVRAMSLDGYREQNMTAGEGADNVDYDPFGVFGDDA